MRWPLVFRRRHNAEVVVLREVLDEVRAQRDDARRKQNAFRSAARTSARQYAEADTDRLRLQGRIDELARRLADHEQTRTIPDVLDDHDVHRKAIADALGEQQRHLNWDQLTAAAGRLRRIADQLQARLDDACGLNDPAIEQAGVQEARRRAAADEVAW